MEYSISTVMNRYDLIMFFNKEMYIIIDKKNNTFLFQTNSKHSI